LDAAFLLIPSPRTPSSPQHHGSEGTEANKTSPFVRSSYSSFRKSASVDRPRRPHIQGRQPATPTKTGVFTLNHTSQVACFATIHATDSLGTWLNIIGNKNLKHLANNGKVVVKFIFPWEEFTVSESYALKSLSYLRVITLDDAAHLTRLANEFQKLIQDYPVIWHWKLQSRDPINTYTRKDRDLPIRRFARESTEAIPVSFIEPLRPVLNQVFEQFGG
jgi:hypothetical protein